MKKKLKGIIVSFRRGRHTQYNRQMIVKIEGIRSRKDAQKVVGWKVIWKSKGGKTIEGVISSPHGNKGKVRAIFSKGMPGQALLSEVIILPPEGSH